jgi:hypothetical protein
MPRFGALNTVSGTMHTLYTAPALRNATVSVNVVNRGFQTALLNLAFSASGTVVPSSTDFIEFNTSIPPGATLERTGITPSNGQRVFVQSNTSDLTIVVWGFEEELV